MRHNPPKFKERVNPYKVDQLVRDFGRVLKPLHVLKRGSYPIPSICSLMKLSFGE